MNFAAAGGRRFVLAVLVFFTCALLLLLGKLSDASFCTITVTAVLGLIAGHTVENVKAKGTITMTPNLIFLAAIAGVAIASWAFGHWGTAGISAKLNAAKAILSSAETKAGGALGAIESTVAHPLAAVQNAEHAMAQKVAEECAKLIAYLGDKSPLQAKRAELSRLEAVMDKGLDDAIALLQKARQP
jgi:hypothetical protein